MNIVVVGDGKVGYTLTASLSKEGHDVTGHTHAEKLIYGLTSAEAKTSAFFYLLLLGEQFTAVLLLFRYTQ